MPENRPVTKKLKLPTNGALSKALQTARLGELLLKRKKITQNQLDTALHIQKHSHQPLGQILRENNVISRKQLLGTLTNQFVLRSAMTATLTLIACTGFATPKAKAQAIEDVPARIKVAFNTNSSHFGKMSSFPALSGTKEKKSTNVKPFTKWTAMFDKFGSQLDTSQNSYLVKEWRTSLAQYEGLSIKEMATRVNTLMNQKRYITDSNNWGTSDYWATPVEFLERGGDCEDFAIAKYAALRALGVPEERLRVAIVQDTLKNIPHAVLVVYAEDGAYILDNQIKTLVSASGAGRYRPIYSINRTGWWLHTAPSQTMVASAR